MDGASYWPRVIWRAFVDTWKFFGGWRILLPPVFFVVGAASYLFRAGKSPVLEELEVAASFGLGTFLVIFVALFIVNLVLTPLRLESEAAAAAKYMGDQLNARIDDLEKQIFDRAARQKLVDVLWELRGDGIKLRNEQFPDEAHFNQSSWPERYEEWRGSVLDHAQQISPNLYAWLERLDRTVPNPAGLKFVNGDHELKALIVSTILHRLQRYLEGELDIERRSRFVWTDGDIEVEERKHGS